MSRERAADRDTTMLKPVAGFRHGLTEPTADATDRMRHTVLNATRHSPARYRPVSRRLLLGSAAAPALAGLAGDVALVPRTGARPPATGAAIGASVGPDDGPTVLLELAAQHSATTENLRVAPGQFIYRRTESTGLHAFLGGPWGAQTVRLRERSWEESWLVAAHPEFAGTFGGSGWFLPVHAGRERTEYFTPGTWELSERAGPSNIVAERLRFESWHT